MRLEGWRHARSLWPSFETVACKRMRPPQDEDAVSGDCKSGVQIARLAPDRVEFLLLLAAELEIEAVEHGIEVHRRVEHGVHPVAGGIEAAHRRPRRFL